LTGCLLWLALLLFSWVLFGAAVYVVLRVGFAMLRALGWEVQW
jgi:hypothetical protein